MASLEELREDRLKKKALLEAQGMSAYPAVTQYTHTIAQFSDAFSILESTQETIRIVGRLLSKRGQGGITFGDIYDGTGKTQIFLKSDEMSIQSYESFTAIVDSGDFITISGRAYTTKRGQQCVFVQGWEMTAKSLRPLPDAWYGLKDDDERFRKRYIDMILDPEVASIARKRSLFWNTIRSYLLEKDFVEVETPVLENTTGGAEARPFQTHHNALDIDVYLRISAGELWQKKLLVGGIPRTFEIGRIFRNEGISNEHLQDYTQLEYYMAYSDYVIGMEMTKELYCRIAQATFGTTTFSIKGFTVDFAGEWKQYDFVAMLAEAYGIDVLNTTIEEVSAALQRFDIAFDVSTISIERGVDLLWKRIRKQLGGPGFLINIPVYLEPLAKRNRTDARTVERMQVILAGSEMGKGFSELNDPVDQKERFMAQQALRDAGDDEAQMADMEFVEALEYGMPPAFGFGLSERLFSFLMDKPVREAQLFPLLRPKGE